MSGEAERLARQMNEYYARRASMHDSYMGYSGNQAMEELLGPLIRRVESYIADRNVLEVACGTGNWTQVLSRRARRVVATDVNAEVIEIARAKSYPAGNVDFRVADAYDLGRIEGRFDAAFGADWWSHVPLSLIPVFLGSLTSRLESGSKVVFIDMLPIENLTYLGSRHDSEGNFIHPRQAPAGEEYEVVKNFPGEEELRAAVGPVGEDFEYRVHKPLRRWMLAFTVK